MSEGLDTRHGGFRAPRVPFDLRCVILAALGFLATAGVDFLLAKWFDTASPVAQMVDLVAQQIDRVAFVGIAFRQAMEAVWGETPYSLEFWQALVTAVVYFAVWSLFGAAVLRTAALKLTRDEPLGLKDALKFGATNWWGFVRAPVLILLFAGFFWACIWLAGAVVSVHVVGSWILVLVLFPLVLVAGLLIILALIGGFVGLPLMWAGLAVEQNGPLEALSRGFSYIFARPFRFFFGYFLLFVIISVLLVAAGQFEVTVKNTLKAGVWRDDLDDAVSKAPDERVGELRDEYLNAEKTRREAEGIANLKNISETEWVDWVGFFWMWLLLSAFLLGFKGYALYFFLGGTASLYLHLRREVDGTDEEEIYPESEEDLAGEGEARWVGEGGADAGEAPAPAEEKPDTDG